MQNRCGLKDTQELRSPPEVDCQQPESPQGGPRHLERPSGHEPGRVPGGAVTARRWPAPRHRAGPLRASGPASVLAFERDSCPCSPLCSGFPLPVPLQLRRSWRCGQAGSFCPRGMDDPDSNSACSSSPRRRAMRSRRDIWGRTPSYVRGRRGGRAFGDPVLLLEVPGCRQHSGGGRTGPYVDQAHVLRTGARRSIGWTAAESRTTTRISTTAAGTTRSGKGKKRATLREPAAVSPDSSFIVPCGQATITVPGRYEQAASTWCWLSPHVGALSGTEPIRLAEAECLNGQQSSQLFYALSPVFRVLGRGYGFRASRSRRLQRTPPRATPRARLSRCGSSSAMSCRLRARPTWCSTSVGRHAARPTRPVPARAI